MAYFWNSVSTSGACGKGKVSSSSECLVLNHIECDFTVAIGGGWARVSDTIVTAPTDIWLWYWYICTRCHWDASKVIDCTYKLQDNVLRFLDILRFPLAFDPCEAYGCYDHSSGLPQTIFFSLSNLSTFYLTIDHPVSPSLTSTTQTPIVCLHFYCSSLCIISHSSFHTVDIPNALFHLLLLYHTTPDLVSIRLVVDRPLWMSLMYIRRPPP